MLFTEPLDAVVAREPWRQRVGYPNSVDDPLWSAEGHQMCDGQVEHESREGSKCWVCTKCGYIGWSTLPMHYPVLTLEQYFALSRDGYLQQKLSEGLSKKQVNDQAQYVMGAALRAAMRKSPEELRDFVEKLSRL